MANKQNLDQVAIAQRLAYRYGIDPERVFFPDKSQPQKPWLGADELMTIARRSNRFQSLEERFHTHIATLNQIVYAARVIDTEGRIFERIGVASVGEKAPDADESDEHSLAKSRALVSALSAAGFNPLRDGMEPVQAEPAPLKPVATFEDSATAGQVSEAKSRSNDLARIHILAEQAGLITKDGGRVDSTEYRAWLLENFNLRSSVAADATMRASIINALEGIVIEK